MSALHLVCELLSYCGFLAELLLAECDDRDRRLSDRRVKAPYQTLLQPTAR
jgi:hypothetical protein